MNLKGKKLHRGGNWPEQSEVYSQLGTLGNLFEIGFGIKNGRQDCKIDKVCGRVLVRGWESMREKKVREYAWWVSCTDMK